ncbi:MAG: hypothetical protein ACI9KE_001350 [Polyangiales bacterium]|jgi:hypothetical protein
MHLRFLTLLALTLMMGCVFDSRSPRRMRSSDTGPDDAGPGFDSGPGFDADSRDVGTLPDAGASRCGDGLITGNEVCEGEPECASDCLSAIFSGTISETDSTWSRNTSTCAEGSGEHYYDTQGFVWRGDTASLTFHADWAAFDGYLHAFDGSFNPASPEAGCLAGDDDEGGTSASAVTVDVARGDRIEAVLSTYSAGGTGDWSLTVRRAF